MVEKKNKGKGEVLDGEAIGWKFVDTRQLVAGESKKVHTIGIRSWEVSIKRFKRNQKGMDRGGKEWIEV